MENDNEKKTHVWANQNKDGKKHTFEYIEEPCALCDRRIPKWSKVYKGKNGKIMCNRCIHMDY